MTARSPSDERTAVKATASTRPQVVVALPELGRGGPDRVLRVVASHLGPERFDVHILVSKADPEMQALLPPTVRLHVLPASRSRIGSRYPVRQTRAALRRIGADIVLATLRMNTTTWLATRVYRNRPALVLRVANHVSENRAELIGRAELAEGMRAVSRRIVFGIDRRALRTAERVVAQSTAMRDDLLQLGIEPDRIVTITNPMDEEEIERRTATPAVPLPGRPALVAVGRLTRQKGFDTLVEALPDLLDRHPDLHLTVFGEGPARGALEARVDHLGIGGSVTLAGHVSDALARVATADLLVAPSRYEGLSNAVLEALCVGVPVVATDGPGASQDLVRHPVQGRLVPPEDPRRLVAAIIETLGDPRDPAAVRRHAFEGRAGHQVAELYADVLERSLACRTRRRSSSA